MIDYNKRLVEVDEILSYLSEDDLAKIPEHIRQTIKDDKDKEYIWKYDTSKELKNQEVNVDTLAFLAYLSMEYLFNEEQKKFMQNIFEMNEKKEEEERLKKFSSNIVFKENVIENNDLEKEELVLCKKPNIFVRMFEKIKMFFKKKNNNN